MENTTRFTVELSNANSCSNNAACIAEVMVVIAVTFLVVVGNVGNLAILLSTPALRNGHGYLLISLSVADLITGLMASLAIYPSATLRSSQDSWPFGDSACLAAAYVNQVGITTSAIGLMLLALERYVAIAHPLRYARTVTKKHVLVCIALNWLASVLTFSGIFSGYPRYFYYPELYTCLTFVLGNIPLAAVWLGMALVPVLVVTVTSCIIGRVLYAGPKRGVDSAVHSATSRKLKAFRMVQVMTATFFLSYMPFFTVGLILGFMAGSHAPQEVVFGSFWLLLANSFFNTVIYVTMNTAYRKRMGEIFDSAASTISRLGRRKGVWDVPLSPLNTVDSNNLLVGALGASTPNVFKDSQNSPV